ncbi:MAG: ISNCY family transposase [Maricaulaceae bacterium]
MKKFEDILCRWQDRRLTCSQAGAMLGVSERTFRRYCKRYREGGLEALTDRRLGRRTDRRVPVDTVEWMLNEYRTHYMGWTVKHFHDHLVKRHSFNWGYTWTKTQLQVAGLVLKAPHKGKHRRKRERRPCRGMLIHQDGSSHDWLGTGGSLDLIVTMDDATSEVYSAFLTDEEGTYSTFAGLWDVFSTQGLPCSVYTDRGSHYFHTPEAGGKVDKDIHTQVGRALAQLGIEHIPAYSPQARGRSERVFRTFQDRLVKELAFEGITDMDAANRYIVETYVPDHNARFAVPPKEDLNAFVPMENKAQLRDILSVQSERVVGNDNCVRYCRKKLQLPPDRHRYHFVKARVRVHEYTDGSLSVFHGPRKLASYTENGDLIMTEQDVGVTRFDAQRCVDMMDKRLTPLDHIPTHPQQQLKRSINVL